MRRRSHKTVGISRPVPADHASANPGSRCAGHSLPARTCTAAAPVRNGRHFSSQARRGDGMTSTIHTGDCREVLRAMAADSIDAVVTDPPYGLSFMGKAWDQSVPGPDYWREVIRVMKPGAHLLAFGGTRTYHRLVCAIEDAGFEIRDQIAWVYSTGFPKSPTLDGAWQGWGAALKPAFEPIVLARKPLAGTVAANVLAHGTGAMNIDGCRIAGEKPATTRGASGSNGRYGSIKARGRIEDDGKGRWPPNLIHDGSDDAVSAFPKHAARFFYCSKASTADREDWLKRSSEISATESGPRRNHHTTVKPTDLMRYLCRLVTPPGGTVLDPFAGSGSTGRGAILEGFDFVGIELDHDYAEIARHRIDAVQPGLALAFAGEALP